MEYILSYTFMTLELLSLRMVADSVFTGRTYPVPIHYSLVPLFAGGNMALLALLPQNIPVVVRVIATVALINIFLNICYVGAWRRKLLLSVLFFVINVVIDDSVISLSMLLFDYSYNTLIYDKGVYICGAFTAKILLLTGAALLAKWQRKRGNPGGGLAFVSWLSMLAVPALSIIIIFLIVRNAMDFNNVGSWVIVITIGLLLCNVVNIFLWNRLETEQKTTLDNALLRQSVQSSVEKLEALETAYAQQRRQTHDYRSHIRTLQGILTSGTREQALAYVNNWAQTPACEEMLVHTNNPVADMLLNHSYGAAEEKGVSIDYWIEDLAQMPIGNAEFVTVLANLLDNAIEAASQCTVEKAVRVKINRTESMLLISVRNTSPPVQIVNRHIETTKENPREHGYGLANIKHVIEKNGGEYTLLQQDGWVQFTAIFPQKP